ncbi:MAG TPA: hypothetical protein VK588_13810 [Chitinophagaceae bacterium]|nr:hypothetical protein [Chitinophagaceae bacterium]
MKNETNHKTEKEIIPSVANRGELAQLSKNFTPSDVKFLLELEANNSEEECLSSAKKMIERLKSVVQNDFDAKKAGLDPKKYEVEEVTL